MTVQGFSLLFKITPFLKRSPVHVALIVGSVVLGSIGIASVSFTLEAQATEVPPNAQPGSILQHQNQIQQFQTQAPWLNRPLTHQDQKGPEADIKQVETNVNAEIYTEPTPEAPASGTAP